MKKSSWWWWWWWWCIFFCGKLEDVKQHYFWELACERRKWRLHILGCATEVNKNHGWTWSCPDFACLTSHLKSNQYYFIYCITIGITCFVWFCSVFGCFTSIFLWIQQSWHCCVVSPNTSAPSKKQSPFLSNCSVLLTHSSQFPPCFLHLSFRFQTSMPRGMSN